MKKIKLYIAISLNGKVAKMDGGVEWLETVPNPEGTDYGYASFYDSIDTTIQGSKTYNQILSWDIEFPYKGKTNYVLTTQSTYVDTEDVTFLSENHVEVIKELKKGKGKDIWLIGGGKANSMLLDAGLVDEIIVFVMPIILENGIDVTATLMKDVPLKLSSTKSYKNGVVEMIYTC
ncbi:MAG: dihydrofolate reductase family protein [Saprospiraceae bacterium]|nr:dihydrofolate reductase family protein [Saprospiraceae bacterium]